MRILVVGLGHTGTTWLAQGIASAPGVQWVNEPDNSGVWPFAVPATRGLPAAPAITRGQHVPRYELLWDLAFGAGWPEDAVARFATRLSRSSRSPRVLSDSLLLAVARRARRRKSRFEHQLVKSVLAFMSLDWMVDRYDPRVVVVWRSPFNRLASLLERGKTGSAPRAVRELLKTTNVWPPPPADVEGIEVERAMWSTCAQMTALIKAARRHPEWLVIRHEDQASDPLIGFARVFDWLGIEWSSEIERYIKESEGEGRLDTWKRVAAEEPVAWKRRLNSDQVKAARRVVERFALLDEMGPIFTQCLEEAG